MVGTLILSAMLLVLEKIVALVRLRDRRPKAGQSAWCGGCSPTCIPEYFALGIPIGLLLGILLAFRKLATCRPSSTLCAGSGLAYGRLLRVPYAFAVGLLLLNLVDRRLGRALFALSLRRAALRPALGRAGRGDQGRRVQYAWASGMTLRIERSEQGRPAPERNLRRAGGQADGMRVAASAERGSSWRPTTPTRSSCASSKGRLVQDSPKFTSPRALDVRQL